MEGCRSTYSTAGLAAVPKGITAKPGKRSRTVIEAEWISRAVEYGCLACRLDGLEPRPSAYHHIVVGGRRLGHLFGFGLCDPGHHQNGDAIGLVSRHPHKARFEKRYGAEMYLLGVLKQRLGVFDDARYET